MIPRAASAEAQAVDALLRTSLAGTALLLALLGLLVAWITLRRAPRPAALPYAAGAVGVLVGVVLVADLMLWAQSRRRVRDTAPEGPEVDRVEVLAQQYSFQFLRPGADGQFGTADDLVTLDRLMVARGRPVVFEVRSKDVVHSVSLPSFRTQAEAVPGRSTRLWFEPTATGRFGVVCAQLCGPAHYQMTGVIEVVAPEAFARHSAQAAADRAAMTAAGARPAGIGWPWGR